LLAYDLHEPVIQDRNQDFGISPQVPVNMIRQFNQGFKVQIMCAADVAKMIDNTLFKINQGANHIKRQHSYLAKIHD